MAYVSQGKQPLPYWIFLAAGVIVTALALITLKTSGGDNNGMRLFAAAGVIFILIGVFKYVTEKKDGQTPEQRVAGRVMDVNINKAVRTIERQHNRQYHKPREKKPPELIRCHRCQTLNYDHSNYCHMCGYVLQK